MKKRRQSIAKRLDAIDAKIQKIESEEKKIEKEEAKVEKVVVRLGKIQLKKHHIIEVIRASAGAFLGVGIGRGLVGLDSVAKDLPWLNVFGILVFILGISALLIYKDERDQVKNKGYYLVWQRLFFIYAVSLSIEFISLLLFRVPYESYTALLKIMIVGSYTAMASAITFSLSSK